jgi:6,7-dimethyl-8-ribityllumazine synthase
VDKPKIWEKKIFDFFSSELIVPYVVATSFLSLFALVGLAFYGLPFFFDFIAAETTKGIAQVSLDSGVYIAYGLITADTIEQAIERAGTKAGNKGFDAALAAIEMSNVVK